jgi:mRNA interferase MazF
MIPPRGTVVTATDPFGDTPIRPFVLVSDATTGHPFPDNESVGIVVTTTQRERAIPISAAFDEGGLPRESFASPWNPITLKEEMIRDGFGRITPETVDQIADEAARYIQTGV